MAFAVTPVCETTISLLRAFTMGADNACISMNLWSVATVVVPFVGGVVVLQYLARRLLGKTPARKAVPLDASANVYGAGPIRSTGARRDEGAK